MDSPYIFYGPEKDVTLPDLNLGELFFDSLQSKSQSDVIVVEYCTGEQITRRKMWQDSVKLAVGLQNLGIRKNDVVAIISKNTWKYLVSTISAFYIGATVCNINHNSSKDDLIHYLMISKPKLLFVEGEASNKIMTLRDELPFVRHVINFDTFANNGEIPLKNILCGDVNCAAFQVQNEYIEEALILYSSGTTGLPKAVLLTTENVKVGLKFLMNKTNFKGETNLGLLPMFHIFGLYISLRYVLSGRVIILEKFKPETFLRSIEEYRITNLIIVPPLVLFLAKSPLVEKYDLSSLEDIVSGAAPLGGELQKTLSLRLGVTVRQLYGLTETCGISCTPLGVQKLGTVGKLVRKCQVKIVDITSGKTLAKNCVGEICYKGPGLMKGYKNNQEATKLSIDDDGFMHLGDIGYFDEDEYLYIVDRAKDLIKYKGFQVSPVQLESILNHHPAIKDAAVTSKPDEKAGELTTALIVRQDNSNITEKEIVSYIAEKVSPEKQLYGGVIFINEIPKTNSGKILRRDLKNFL